MADTWVILACGVGLGLCLAYIFLALVSERKEERANSSDNVTPLERSERSLHLKRVKRDQEHDAPRVGHPLGP